jgi:hypothetical protein
MEQPMAGTGHTNSINNTGNFSHIGKMSNLVIADGNTMGNLNANMNAN